MSCEEYEARRYELAAELLPRRLRNVALGLDPARRGTAEEFRLRAGRPLTAVFPEGEEELPGGAERVVQGSDLNLTLDIATQLSAYSSVETLRAGYITVPGGFRIGVCGTAVLKDREVSNIKNVSSLALRISRERKGTAEEVLGALRENGRFQSTLILSPPGGGKTTLLRDLVRLLSDGSTGMPGYRVAVADERGEIAVCYNGTPQMDVGARTDVLDACPKAAGMMMLLRAMNPQIIAADEITAPEDIKALEAAANCGVKLAATAHAEGIPDLLSRPVYRSLLSLGIFKKAVVIRMVEGKRLFTVEDVPCCG
ncbi:stage III sporulation protein AA [Papillibacter cinnamivorans]|uniref:stage III sporulation protein AA n=1 Tax=Papillibacter cinnamivorans TaxID=100176 RepID=UPI001FA86E95|nr:stage III sporulation protein AA [Papillibacter cinnamivorans]